VVGGGPAGLAAAITVVRAGLTAIVVERTGYDALRVGEHLPPDAKPRLAVLGVAGLLQSGGHAACPGIRSVWGASEPDDKDYLFNPHGMGMNLFRPEFDRALAAAAAALGAEVATGAKVLDVARSAETWDIAVLRGGARHAFAAAFAVDASGRSASFAKRVGARPIVHDNLIGIFGRCRAAVPATRLVHIEAQEHGWWYSAGLADGSLVATFMTDADLADLSGEGKTALWHRQLADTCITRTRADLDGPIDALHVRSARTQRLDAFAGPGWLAAGDAAMSFDPLSSDGLAKGFDTGMRAGAAAAAWCGGDRSGVRAYAQEAEHRFATYIAERRGYYRAERRWKQSAFWRRRHAAADSSLRLSPA
jgi:flavin-dependent dehydrogenase